MAISSRALRPVQQQCHQGNEQAQGGNRRLGASLKESTIATVQRVWLGPRAVRRGEGDDRSSQAVSLVGGLVRRSSVSRSSCVALVEIGPRRLAGGTLGHSSSAAQRNVFDASAHEWRRIDPIAARMVRAWWLIVHSRSRQDDAHSSSCSCSGSRAEHCVRACERRLLRGQLSEGSGGVRRDVFPQTDAGR